MKYFTLLELSVVLLIIVIVASVGVSVASPALERSIENQYIRNVEQTANAITGDSSLRDYDGSQIPNGYLNDMGSFPSDIQDLWTKPSDTDKLYSKRTFSINDSESHLYGGWNGPYYDTINEKLRNNLSLKVGDFDSTNFADEIVDNDDIKLSANGYSESETNLYGEENFSPRTISIIGIPNEFTAKVTYVYLNDGELQTSEQAISNSAETDVKLPKGLCAVYAQLITDHEVLQILANPPASPNTDDQFLVADSATTGDFINQENKLATWNGSSYDFASANDQDSLLDINENKYYLYNLGSWEEKTVTGTQTPRIIKTMKTDILLELE